MGEMADMEFERMLNESFARLAGCLDSDPTPLTDEEYEAQREFDRMVEIEFGTMMAPVLSMTKTHTLRPAFRIREGEKPVRQTYRYRVRTTW